MYYSNCGHDGQIRRWIRLEKLRNNGIGRFQRIDHLKKRWTWVKSQRSTWTEWTLRPVTQSCREVRKFAGRDSQPK